ncbi:Trypsin [Tenacibaculum sp. MAR_2009_124]|uniref:trypsin-like serine protease n=1 Tax=Tenacibaculum sp. MAR_2009_124 TaxID=1250059 RepID=UPI000898F369|nr:trypsin-like serine protease [Tenacibaculum sp. MAR_2009_124]SEB48708.1 Trypsin [Tenacibaculum sp. MAR_2009_124]
MKKTISALLIIIMSFSLMSLIVRHDVPDERFITLGKKYPQICHLSDGESTLIKENWVVTAAHAAILLNEELKKGETPQVTIDHKQYDVEKIILHPNFHISETFIENDIALIRIKGNITNIPFAKLYDKQNGKGKEITIVGSGDFGTGLTGPQNWDKITRAATNRIDEIDGQWIIFNFDNPESENTTELEGVSGPGDSGGPAFIDVDNVRYIVGVSSNQQDNGKEGVYGVTEYYARINFYKKWIEKNIE